MGPEGSEHVCLTNEADARSSRGPLIQDSCWHLYTRCMLLRLAAAVLAFAAFQAASPQYDLVIWGGSVIDGSGARGRNAAVAVKGGRIVAIGSVRRTSGSDAIDATGLVV